MFSGRVSDIAWDSESKRVIAVGEGKDKYLSLFYPPLHLLLTLRNLDSDMPSCLILRHR